MIGAISSHKEIMSKFSQERGAYKIYALATHGILSKEAPR